MLVNYINLRSFFSLNIAWSFFQVRTSTYDLETYMRTGRYAPVYILAQNPFLAPFDEVTQFLVSVRN